MRETAVIQRSTYSLGRRPFAVRVSGDPVAANNGIFYFHTDHLGSTSVMTKHSDGYIVTGSLARYTPFGDWRTEPSTNLTDRSFTGHMSNNTGSNDLGLIYMNSRFYVPSLNRFASADTIVPDPTNPQSFNRYSYVNNNTINFNDPTGHLENCALLGNSNDIQGCQNPSPPSLPSTPPGGLSDRPDPNDPSGPGGQQAYNGLVSLQHEGRGWWGDQIDAREATMILLNGEFGNLKGLSESGNDLPPATIQVTANRYETFCSGGAWSAQCFNGFWAYSEPITNLETHAADRNNARNNDRYENQAYMERLNITADNILQGNVQGSKAPFHWATVGNSETVQAFSSGERQTYWSYGYKDQYGEVYSIFVVLTSDQHTGILR